MNTTQFILALLASGATAFGFFPRGIRLAHFFKALDLPSSRKRHTQPTPIVGGVCIFIAWTLGMIITAAFSPQWGHEQTISLGVTAFVIWSLIGLGLWDDLKGISPKMKLIVQFALAAFTVKFEPNLHAICLEKGAGMHGAQYAVAIFLPAMIWLVGVMNAINLIDGIDGLAGGTSLLITLSLLVLNFFPGDGNYFGMVSLSCAALPLAAFLKHNWAPARVFLGDNGSFAIGYLLALNGLIHHPNPNLVVGIPGLFIIFAYPIIDMGLCVFRRFRSGYPLFKADRSHLHHRIQRLGLSKGSTTGFLLCIVAYSQLTALFINSAHLLLVLTTISSFTLSMFIFIYLVRSVERWHATHIIQPSLKDFLPPESVSASSALICVDLMPLLEVGALEEKENIQLLISSIIIMLSRSLGQDAEIYFSGYRLHISPNFGRGELLKTKLMMTKINARLNEFQELYGLQYSMAGLPVSVIPGVELMGNSGVRQESGADFDEHVA
ncbi:MAG: glycosyltransferase family 4 protein [Bdellovibrionota bacterium]